MAGALEPSACPRCPQLAHLPEALGLGGLRGKGAIRLPSHPLPQDRSVSPPSPRPGANSCAPALSLFHQCGTCSPHCQQLQGLRPSTARRLAPGEGVAGTGRGVGLTAGSYSNLLARPAEHAWPLLQLDIYPYFLVVKIFLIELLVHLELCGNFFSWSHTGFWSMPQRLHKVVFGNCRIRKLRLG